MAPRTRGRASRRRVPGSTLALLAAFWVAGPTAARAQDAVELWGAWGAWSGSDGNAEGFEPGYALGASYVADVGVPVDIGVDVVFARFDYTPVDWVIDEFQASLVLRRWVLGSAARVRPFVGGRVGYTRLTLDIEDVLLEQNGVLVGPVMGLVVPTGKTLSPYVSVESLRQSYRDATLFLEGEELPQSGGASWRFFVRIGVAFGSGWERR